MENKNNYQFNIQGKELTIQREFNGSLAQVWRAYTDSEILDLWWAPKPWKCKTKSQDFRVGGKWLYAMVGPENEEHWASFQYDQIENESFFSGKDAFTDSEGNVNKDMPASHWKITFEEIGDKTIVRNYCSYESEEILHQFLDMGFKEGYESGMSNLDNLLKNGLK